MKDRSDDPSHHVAKFRARVRVQDRFRASYI